MHNPPIFSTPIKPEWLDYNGHMNVAYYVLIFDLAGEALVAQLGMGEEYTRQSGISWMVLENHTSYLAEVSPDDEVEVSVQLIDHDHKRLHLYFEMHCNKGGRHLAATQEQMAMCVDLNNRRSSNFPDQIMASIHSMAEQQAGLESPAGLGRVISIRKK